MQVFVVTGLFAGQHNTKLHGTIFSLKTLSKSGLNKPISPCFEEAHNICYVFLS